MYDTVTFEIVNPIAVIATMPNGWTKEINLVSWCGKSPKLDIRDWNEDHTRMGRGLTLKHEEAVALANALSEYIKEGGK